MKPILRPLIARAGRALVRAAAPKPAAGGMPWLVPNAASRWMAAGVAWYTPQQVEYVFRNALGGDLVSQWEMFDLMESTWPELSQCLNELKDSVANMRFEVVPWSLRNEEATPEAERRAKLVDEVLWTLYPRPDADENDLQDTMRDLLDARGKGISVLEIDWETRRTSVGPALAPRATRWVHPSWYGYENAGSRLMLRTSASNFNTLAGFNPQPGAFVPFPDHKFIIGICKNKTGHPLGSALLHVLGFWWAAFNFTADAFFDLAQVFGQPIRWATYDPGMAADDKAKLKTMLEDMGRMSWGMFPEGVQMELKEAMKSASDNPQKVLLDTANKICRLTILRQTLTSDVGSSGSRALGDVHERTEAGVTMACSQWTCKTLQQLIRAICILNFGDDREMPWLKPCDEDAEPKDVADVLNVVKQAGLEPTDDELAEIGERLGFEVQRVAPPAPSPGFGAFPDNRGPAIPMTATRAPDGSITFFSAGSDTPTLRNDVDKIAAARATALGSAYRGAMAPFRAIILASSTREECLAKLSAAYADWSPERLNSELESALQLCAAAGAAAGTNAK